jgi:predicted dehydrogenase
MLSATVKFAVIGCGHIGKRHAEMIKRNPEAELVALCDVLPADQVNTAQFAVPQYANLAEMIAAHPEIEVVNIATPNGFHCEQAIEALESYKHVVIEKPLALSKADAEKVIYKALQVHRHVFAVMQNRYSPPSVWIKDMVESGKLGKLYMVQLNCYWNRDYRYYKSGSWHGNKELDGGTLFTQFSHFIDILYWLFGDIHNIKSRFYDFNHAALTDFEDSGIVTFDFLNGGSGVLNFSTAIWDRNLESSMTIIAEKGAVKIGGQYMDKVEYCHVQDYDMPDLPPTNPGNDYGAYKGSAQNHNFIINNVVDVLKNRSSITTNALEGLKVVEIIERIYKYTNSN